MVLRTVAAMLGLLAIAPLACSDRPLGHRIEEQVRGGAGTVVDLAALTEFAWDRLHVFPPYTTDAKIEEELGFAWRAAAVTGIESSESIVLLAFVRGDQVVGHVAHPRSRGDFAFLARKGGWAPSEAVFIVREENHGEPRLVLRPRPAGDG